MKKLVVHLVFFLGTVNFLDAQSLFSDSVQLQSVEISASRITEQSPVGHQKMLDSTVLADPSSGNLGKVISENTGIFVKTYGQGALASVSFRGSGASHTGVYWNGFSLNSAMNGMVDLSLLPIAFYDQVEIDYGNSSIQKGAGGLGGSINLKSVADFSNSFSAELHQSIGSYGHIGTYGSVGTGNNKWQSSTKIYRQTADNDFEYRNLGKEGFPVEKQENAHFLQHGFLQSIYFRPTHKNLLKLEAWYVKTEREIPSIMTVIDKNEIQIDESIRLLAGMKHYLEKGTVEFATNYQQEYLDYSNQMLEQSSETTTNSWKNLLKAEYPISSNFKMFSKLHLDLQKIDNAVYNTAENQWRQAIYLSAQYHLQKLHVEVFIREENMMEREVFILPGAAISYKFGQNGDWLLSSSIAQNMKYPSLNDLYWIPAGNPNLQAEKSANLEVQLATSRIQFNESLYSQFSFTAFRYDIQNYIQWQPTAFGYWRAQNLKEIQSEGIELEADLKWKFNRTKIELRGSYSYTKSINTKAMQEDDESVDKQLFYVPEHLWNAHLELKRNNYFMKLSQHYTGLRYTTSDNSDFLPAFALMGIKIGKSWKQKKHRWTIEFAVNNLLDKDYQAIQWRPMPGRNYIASIKYHFEK